MGTPNNVAPVDKAVKDILATMAIASQYKQEWPNSGLKLLDIIKSQLKPIVKMFGQSLQQSLADQKQIHINLPEVRGIFLTAWSFTSGTTHCVCLTLDSGWVLVNSHTKQVYFDCPELLAKIITDDIGGTQMFIGACAGAVSDLFRYRRRRLDELERGCLLQMLEYGFHPSKFGDVTRLVEFLTAK